MQGLPATLLVKLLSVVGPEPQPAGSDGGGNTSSEPWDYLHYLFLLLPTSCHPAILAAQLRTINTTGSVHLKSMPSYDLPGANGPSGLSFVCSAAAVLAGGEPTAAGHPSDARVKRAHDLLRLAEEQLCCAEERPTKRQKARMIRAQCAAEEAHQVYLLEGCAALPLDGVAGEDLCPLTRCDLLHMGLTVQSECTSMHSVCAALAQMPCLRYLDVTLNCTSDVIVSPDWCSDLVNTLAQSHLTRLEVDMKGCVEYRRLATRGVIGAICNLSGLQDLALRGGVMCRWHGDGGMHVSRTDVETDVAQTSDVLEGLARLTALTRLDMLACKMHPRCVSVAAAAVETLPQLQQLQLPVDV